MGDVLRRTVRRLYLRPVQPADERGRHCWRGDWVRCLRTAGREMQLQRRREDKEGWVLQHRDPPCAPGSDCSRYFLKVPKTVCKAPTTPAPKDVDCKKVSSAKRSSKRRKACKATDGCMWTTHKGCVAASK